MINYFYDRETTLQRMWVLVKTMFKRQWIIASICLIFGLYLFPLGIIYQDRDAIVNGSALLFLFVAALIYSIVVFCKLYKSVVSNFNNHSQDGLLHYSLFVRDSNYVFECIESEEKLVFAKKDIKKLIRKNGIIVIMLYTKHIITFPDREDIYELLMN